MLIIWRSHVQRSRSGLKDALNHVRQKYWVTRGRQTVKGVTKEYVICLKQNSNLSEAYRLLHIHTTELILISRFTALALII